MRALSLSLSLLARRRARARSRALGVRRYDAINSWARILDFGTGSPEDNIFMATGGTEARARGEIFVGTGTQVYAGTAAWGAHVYLGCYGDAETRDFECARARSRPLSLSPSLSRSIYIYVLRPRRALAAAATFTRLSVS